MFTFGLLLLLGGAWCIDCAVTGRPPLHTLAEIFHDPKDYDDILSRERETWGYGDGDQGTSQPGVPTDPSGGFPGNVVATAEAQIGKPYKWGADGPDAFDCSGLCYYAYGQNGYSIPRTTALQLARGQRVARDDLLPGDLVFPTPVHVMLYAGGGQCVEAPHTGEDVQMSTIYSFYTARRFVEAGGGPPV